MISRTLTLLELMDAIIKLEDTDELPMGVFVEENSMKAKIVETFLDDEGDILLKLQDETPESWLNLEDLTESLEDYGETKFDGTQRLVYADSTLKSLSIEYAVKDSDGNALLQTC